MDRQEFLDTLERRGDFCHTLTVRPNQVIVWLYREATGSRIEIIAKDFEAALGELRVQGQAENDE